MNEYSRRIIEAFKAYQNEDNAGKMKAYMRNQFEFLGIRTPERKTILREFLKEHGTPTSEEYQEVVQELWQQPEREYQYIALALLEKRKKYLNPADLELVEKLVVQKSWWDTIDTIASHLVGALGKVYPNETAEYLEKWIHTNNIWLNRTAILYQLGYKQNTNEERLFSYITKHKQSKEFFIQKAIGWALREYSKTAPDSVKAFIEKENLAPLSTREGLKHIQKIEKENA